MFSQKEIADAFGVNRSTMCMALSGKPHSVVFEERQEGERTVNRPLKLYPHDVVFLMAVKSGKLEEYKELCLSKGIEPEIFNSARRGEDKFCDMLKAFVPEGTIILKQKKIGKFFVDFLLPDFALVVEYDDKYHRQTAYKEYDMERERIITDDHGLSVIRIPCGKEMQGLFRVAQSLLSRST